MGVVYKPGQLADKLKVTRQAITKMCREGGLPSFCISSFRVGNQWRIVVDEGEMSRKGM